MRPVLTLDSRGRLDIKEYLTFYQAPRLTTLVLRNTNSRLLLQILQLVPLLYMRFIDISLSLRRRERIMEYVALGKYLCKTNLPNLESIIFRVNGTPTEPVDQVRTELETVLKGFRVGVPICVIYQPDNQRRYLLA